MIDLSWAYKDQYSVSRLVQKQFTICVFNLVSKVNDNSENLNQLVTHISTHYFISPTTMIVTLNQIAY